MPLRFCFPNGEAMPLQPGLPANYNGFTFNEAVSHHTITDTATIINQEYTNLYFDVILTVIQWREPNSIVCDYDFPMGVFTRVPLDRPIHERLKGAGKFDLRRFQYCIITGSTWKGELQAHHAGLHSFVTIHWSKQFLRELLTEHPALVTAMANTISRLPVRLIGAPTFLNTAMRHHISRLFQFNYTNNNDLNELGQLVREYFRQMLFEWHNDDPVKRKMSKEDWFTVHKAKKLIDDDLQTQLTTPEISVRIDMNEYKLKKLFSAVTGFTIEEYRKYRLCVNVGRNILLQPDEPFKSFFLQSGYGNMPNFSRGFLKHCCCKPTELRRDTWNVNGIVHDKNVEA